jgi:Holliday junction resolvase RusA-like endonuclease
VKLRDPITLVVEGEPPRKNERHRIVWDRDPTRPPFLVDTAAVEAWWGELQLQWRMAKVRPIVSGVWEIEIRAFWSRERHLEDLSFGIGDLDAPISAVLDGLQAIGAIDNDVRFDDGTLRRRHDKRRPRVEITLRELPPEGPEQLALEVPP